MTNLLRRRFLVLAAPNAARADWFERKVEDGIAQFVETSNAGNATVLG